MNEKNVAKEKNKTHSDAKDVSSRLLLPRACNVGSKMEVKFAPPRKPRELSEETHSP